MPKPEVQRRIIGFCTQMKSWLTCNDFYAYGQLVSNPTEGKYVINLEIFRIMVKDKKLKCFLHILDNTSPMISEVITICKIL